MQRKIFLIFLNFFRKIWLILLVFLNMQRKTIDLSKYSLLWKTQNSLESALVSIKRFAFQQTFQIA